LPGIKFRLRTGIKKPAKPLQDFAGNLCRLLKLFRHPAMQRQKNSFTLNQNDCLQKNDTVYKEEYGDKKG